MSAMQRKWFMHWCLSLAIIKCVSNYKRKILNVKYNSNKYKMWNTILIAITFRNAIQMLWAFMLIISNHDGI